MSNWRKSVIPGALVFGAFIAVLLMLRHDATIAASMAWGGFSGALFSVGMFLTFRVMGYFLGEEVAYGKTHWSQTIELAVKLDQAEDLCKCALETLKNVKKKSISKRGKTQIVARTGTSFRSFGEAVTINLCALEKSLVRLEIYSKSKYDRTLVDWGVNRINIETINEYLKRTLDQDEVVEIGPITCLDSQN
jgi:hypothetical protein